MQKDPETGYYRLPVKGWLLVAIYFFVIAFLAAEGCRSGRGANGTITKGINNVRQIFFGLGLYANDNEGAFPDGSTANDALRKLIAAEIIEKEHVFGCPGSYFVPDIDLGVAPDFSKAIEPGENHWMYIYPPEGSRVGGSRPLLVEAPDMSTGVPRWHPKWSGTRKPGRTWSSGRVIVCTGDGSVSTWKVEGSAPSSKLKSGTKIVDFADPLLQLRHVELLE